MKKKSKEDRFTQGYMCAMSSMFQKVGDHTNLTETVSENFTSIAQLRREGVDEYDIEILKPVFREIIQKRKRASGQTAA